MDKAEPTDRVRKFVDVALIGFAPLSSIALD
jgi:hypothetical protein